MLHLPTKTGSRASGRLRLQTPGGRRAGARALRFETLEDRSMLSATLAITPYSVSDPLSLLTSALIASNSGLAIVSSSFVPNAVENTTSDGQAGIFHSFDFGAGATKVSLPDGVILTTGKATLALGPNDQSGAGDHSGTPGDANLTGLVGAQTFDANSLTIQFTAAANVKSIQFEFVFGSEEFPEFVGKFNDVFGAFLDDQQISFDTLNGPITVNNNFFELNNSHDTSHPDVTNGKTAVSFNLQYDGLTRALTTKAPLNPAVAVHTLKFAIADTKDSALDTGVFLAGLTGSSDILPHPSTGTPPVVKAGGPYHVESGSTVQLDASGTFDPDGASETLTYQWDLNGDGVFGETGAAATNGDETGIAPFFKAPNSQNGTFVVALQVIDSTGLKGTDTAIVIVNSTTLPIFKLPDATSRSDEPFVPIVNNAVVQLALAQHPTDQPSPLLTIPAVVAVGAGGNVVPLAPNPLGEPLLLPPPLASTDPRADAGSRVGADMKRNEIALLAYLSDGDQPHLLGMEPGDVLQQTPKPGGTQGVQALKPIAPPPEDIAADLWWILCVPPCWLLGRVAVKSVRKTWTARQRYGDNEWPARQAGRFASRARVHARSPIR
jgi:hypothetical protein